MHSYILTGIRTGPFVKLLRRRGFTPNPGNIGRVLFIFQNAFWSSFFSWRERKIYGEKINNFPVPADPVFIIGHWRTGTTFLHQILALDPQFITPTLFQVTFPESFMVSESYFRPIMGPMVRQRPMDNVRQGFDDPQEDEFAVLKLTLDSPLINLVLPGKPGYFLTNSGDCIPAKENRELWKKQVGAFYAKICKDSGKTLLLKNPFHSLRIPFLCKTFPGARFIHLHRHPYKVVASSMHLWKVMAKDNQLKGKRYNTDLQEITEGLKNFYSVIERDLAEVPSNRQYVVSYEDLEADPIASVKEIYQALGLKFTGHFEDRIRSFLEETKDFKKNSYTFDDEQKAQVYGLMKDQFEQYHYKR